MGYLLTSDLGLDPNKYPPTTAQSVGELRAIIEGLTDETPLVFVTGLTESPVVLGLASGATTVVQPFIEEDPNSTETPDTLVLAVGVSPESVFQFVFETLGASTEEQPAATDSEAGEGEVTL